MKGPDIPSLGSIAGFAVEAIVGITVFAVTVTVGVYAVFG